MTHQYVMLQYKHEYIGTTNHLLNRAPRIQSGVNRGTDIIKHEKYIFLSGILKAKKCYICGKFISRIINYDEIDYSKFSVISVCRCECTQVFNIFLSSTRLKSVNFTILNFICTERSIRKQTSLALGQKISTQKTDPILGFQSNYLITQFDTDLKHFSISFCKIVYLAYILFCDK